MAQPAIHDAAGALSPEELRHAYAIATTDHTRVILQQLKVVVSTPGMPLVALDNFDDWLRQSVPAFHRLNVPSYDSDGPDREPPIFDTESFQAILDEARQLAADGGGKLLLIVDILECLLYDYPQNFHPFSPRGPPPRATVLVVQALRSLFGLLKVKAAYWIHDVFTICRAIALAAWKIRHGYAPNLTPPAAWIQSAQLLGDLFFALLDRNNIELSVVLLSGSIASQFAGRPAAEGVKLESKTVNSPLLGLDCYTSYHYSIMVNSSYPQLRSALLYRLCLLLHEITSTLPTTDPTFHLPPVSDIYNCMLVLLSPYRFVAFEHVSSTFSYDPVGDPSFVASFLSVSKYIKNFVRIHGTGRSAGVYDPDDVMESRDATSDRDFLTYLLMLSPEHLRTLVWDQGFEAEVLEYDHSALMEWVLSEPERIALGAAAAPIGPRPERAPRDAAKTATRSQGAALVPRGDPEQRKKP
ncbi:hypothetical protein JCM10908_006486 [Rhodotorula pacifica]|uniref:uncharacterized protein n=1 Tax=Rhodotorula pacifica TaxID=1495444 RepID=UPI00317F536A